MADFEISSQELNGVDIDQHIDMMADKYQLDRGYFRAMIGAESGGRQDAISPKGALGMAQLMPATAKSLGVDPSDPYQNVEGGAKYLKQQLDRFGSYDLALAAYNAGPENVAKYGGIPPFEETQKYVQRIKSKLPQTFEIGQGDLFEVSASELAQENQPLAPTEQKPQYGTVQSYATAIGSGVMEPLASTAKSLAIEQRAGEYKRADAKPTQITEGMASGLIPTPSGGLIAGSPGVVGFSPTTSGSPISGTDLEGNQISITPLVTQQPITQAQISAAQEAIKTPVEQKTGYKIGEFLSVPEDRVPVEIKNSTSYQVLKNIAQLPTQVGTYVLGGGLPAAAQAIGMEESSMYDRGRRQGFDERTSINAAVDAANLGLLDVAGIVGLTPALTGAIGRKFGASAGASFFSRVASIAEKYPRTAAGLAGAAEEIFTENLQTLGEDAIAKKYFNETVDWLANAKNTTVVAGTAGFISSALMAAIGIKVHGRAMRDILANETKNTVVDETKNVKSPEPIIDLTDEISTITPPKTGEGLTTATPPDLSDIKVQEKEYPAAAQRIFDLLRQKNEEKRAEIQTKSQQIDANEEAAQRLNQWIENTINNPQNREQEVGSPLIMPKNPEGTRAVTPEVPPPPMERPSPPSEFQRISENARAAGERRNKRLEKIENKIYNNKRGINRALEYYKEKGIDLEIQELDGGKYKLRRMSNPYVQNLNEGGSVPSEVSQEESQPFVQKMDVGERLVPKTPQEFEQTIARLNDVTDEVAGTGRFAKQQRDSAFSLRDQEFEARGDAQQALVGATLDGEVEYDFDSGKYKIKSARPRGSSVKFYSFDPIGFFSQLVKTTEVDSKSWPKKMTSAQVEERIGILAKKGLVKREEWEDSKRLTPLGEFLESRGEFSREEIREKILENQIQVEEVRYSGPTPEIQKELDRLEILEEEFKRTELDSPENVRAWRAVQDTWERLESLGYDPMDSEFMAKYADSYVLPGPKTNDVEVVLTSPQSQLIEPDSFHYAEDEQGRQQIAWFRGNERETDGTTTDKVFFIEEIQSLRHQKGRDEGYLREIDKNSIFNENLSLIDSIEKLAAEIKIYEKDNSDKLRELYNIKTQSMMDKDAKTYYEALDNYSIRLSDMQGELSIMRTRQRELSSILEGPDEIGTPDAPFRDSWPRLVMKEALRTAVRRGSKYLAWTTGEQQNERWSNQTDLTGIYGASGETPGFKNGRPSLILDAIKEVLKPIKPNTSWIDINGEKQPAVEITPEIEKKFSNPVSLYSFDPISFIPKLASLIRKDVKRSTKQAPIVDTFVDDISKITKTLAQTRWLAKDNPRLEPLVSVADRVSDDYSNNFAKSLEQLGPLSKLESDEKRVVWNRLWQVEGKRAAGVTEDFYIENPNGSFSKNPLFYQQYEQWASQQFGGEKRLAEAALAIRSTYDNALIDVWNAAIKNKSVTPSILSEMKQRVKSLPNYLPHKRYGDYVIEGYVGDKKVVDYAFELSKIIENIPLSKGKLNEARIREYLGPRIVAQLEDDPYIQKLGVTKWVPGRRIVDQTTEFYNNSPMLFRLLDDVVSKASDSITDPKIKAVLEKQKPFDKAIADTLKSRGGFGHFSKRKGIYGYERERMGRVTYDYLSGIYGTIAKMETANQLTEASKLLDPARSTEYGYGLQLLQNMLEKRSGIETISQNLSTLAALKYMWGNIKNPLLNLTTAFHYGVSRLSAETGPKAEIYLGRAMKKLLKWGTKKTGLSSDEIQFLSDMSETGTTSNTMIREFRRNMLSGEGALPGALDRMLQIGMEPMAVTEKYSRQSIALASYLAAKDKAVTSKRSIEKYNLNNPSYQDLHDFAKEITLDSHGLFGKANKPEIFRTGRLGKALAPAYIFSNFSQNLIHLYSFLARQGMAGNKNALYGLGRAMTLNLVFAGALGIPLAETIRQAIVKAFGDDPVEEMRKRVGSKKIADVLTFGVPSLVNATLHGSYSMEVPDGIEDLFGIPVSMAKDIQKGMSSINNGDYLRAAETLIPLRLVSDIIKDYRLSTRGATTPSGTPISDPSTGDRSEPMKYTSYEGLLRAAGIQPLREAKVQQIQNTMRSLDEVRESKANTLANRYALAFRLGDDSKMERILDEVSAWNEFWIERDRPDMLINLKNQIKSRKVDKKQRKRARSLYRDLVDDYFPEDDFQEAE